MRAVVLQPMYLPWMGYFGLVDIADVFVFYDDVQFVRRSWQNRNRIKWQDGSALWLTVPVHHHQYGQMITQVTIDNRTKWSNKHLERIKQAYSAAPYFGRYSSMLESIFVKNWEHLADFDIRLIVEIASLLGLGHNKFKKSSEYPSSGSATDKLVNLLKLIGADEYVSGPAATSYLEVEKLRQAGISLYWFRPEHPTYSQLWGDFVSYLSVIDLIFNLGPESMQLIRDASHSALQKDPKS